MIEPFREKQRFELTRQLDARMTAWLPGTLTTAATITKQVSVSGDFRAVEKGSAANGEHDIATEADRLIDNMVRAKLIELYPDYDVITEESAPHRVKAPRGTVMLDSLDETSNFAQGGIDYGTLVAVYDAAGKPEHALMHMIGRQIAYVYDSQSGVYSVPYFNGQVGQQQTLKPLPRFDRPTVSTRADRLHLTKQYLPESLSSQVQPTDTVNLRTLQLMVQGEVGAIAYTWKGPRRGGDWDIAAPAAILTALGGEVLMCKPGKPFEPVHYDASDPMAISEGTVLFLAPGMREQLGL